ncbi:hypothetical protein FQZ97_1094160 [compost metagenome]
MEAQILRFRLGARAVDLDHRVGYRMLRIHAHLAEQRDDSFGELVTAGADDAVVIDGVWVVDRLQQVQVETVDTATIETQQVLDSIAVGAGLQGLQQLRVHVHASLPTSTSAAADWPARRPNTMALQMPMPPPE